MKLAILFGRLENPGGAERVAVEEALHFDAHCGWQAEVVTFGVRPEAFFALRPRCRVLRDGRFLVRLREVARYLATERPDYVLAQTADDAIYLLLAPLMGAPRVPYSVKVHGSLFWFPWDRLKYTVAFRPAFRRCRDHFPGQRRFIPRRAPAAGGLLRRLWIELLAVLQRAAVRRAERVFSMSQAMAREVGWLYGRPGSVAAGGLPEAIFRFRPGSTTDIRGRAGGNPLILNVNRLDPRKRVDDIIRAMPHVLALRPAARLVVVGTGPERAALEAEARRCGVLAAVLFLGHVADAELWEWLVACDVFVHMQWADFAIAPLEALALGRPVVWSREMQPLDGIAADCAPRPPAGESPEALAEAILAALGRFVDGAGLRCYEWSRYFARLSLACPGMRAGYEAAGKSGSCSR